MTLRRFVKKLPGVLQTEVQKEFYAATFDQLFNPANVEAAQGFIGRRTGDVLDPLKDNYLEEPTKERAAYQLEPIAYAVNSALEDVNHYFYDDIVNYVAHKGGNVDNHDRLFADRYYSFAPPIDVDKYLNYQNYLWLPGDGTDPTNTAPIAFITVPAAANLTPAQIDQVIEGTYDPALTGMPAKGVIGSMTFNTSESVYQGQSLLSPLNFDLTSGIRIRFVGSASYDKPLYVEGVGRGIRLIEEQSVIYNSSEVDIVDSNGDAIPTAATDILATPDYITIERGSVEGSAWSRTNRWFHEDSVDAITQLGQLQGGTIVSGGAGYNIGDVLLVNQGDGTGGSFVVTGLGPSQSITGISVFTRGSGYTFANVDETGTPSPVSNLEWDNEDPFGLGSAWDPDNVIKNPSAYLLLDGQDTTDYDGTVIGGSVSLGGTGYTVGDVLTVVDPGVEYSVEPTFTVSSVDPFDGAVTGISLLSSGAVSAIPLTPTVSTTVTPAGGTGCVINLSINGTFVGGAAFLNPADHGKFIAMDDGSIVRIDTVDAGTNDVTAFTIVSGPTEIVFTTGDPRVMGSFDASIRITTDGAGAISNAKIVNPGAGYHAGGVINVANTLTGGTGVLTYTVANGRMDTITVTTPGTGYTADSVSLLNALDIPASTSTDASGNGFVLNPSTANEKRITLWDDNTITTGSGANAFIEGDLASAVSRSNKANRPILEFKRDLELYDFGRRYLTSVDVVAATENFGDIESQPSNSTFVDGVKLETGMRLIFLDPDTIVDFLDWDEAVPMANDYSSLAFNDTTKTIIRTGGTAFDSQLSPGDFVTVTNATQTGNNGTFEVISVNSTTIQLDAGVNIVTDDPDFTAILSQPIPPNSNWDATPFETSGASGAVTRFVWEVDADGASIVLNRYDPLLPGVAGAGYGGVAEGDVVNVTQGQTWAGYEFYQVLDEFIEEFRWTDGQQKTSRNQAMLYQLYDTSGIPLNDDLEYPDSTHVGSEIFSYKVLTQERLNELGGGTLIDDQVLGFPLETKGFRQLGDVVFENDLETNRENYTPVGLTETEINGYYYFKQYEVNELRLVDYYNSEFISFSTNSDTPISGESYQTNWKTSTLPEEQRVIDRYLTTSDTEDTFDVSAAPPADSDACLVVAQGRRLNTTEFAYLSATQQVKLFALPTESDGLVANGSSSSYVFNIQENLEITIDGKYQEEGMDYTITDTTPGNMIAQFTNVPAEGSFIEATNRASGAPGVNEVVEILTCTFEALPEDSIGYFEIPNGLENNPNNEEILEQSWNEFTPHFTSIITEQDVYEGDAFGAGNNYRDTAKDGSLGTFALQSQSPMLKTMFCASNSDLDIVDAIRFSSTEYTRFKNKYIKTAMQLLKEGFQPFNPSNPINVSIWVDEILRRVTRGREYADAFKDTYMIAWNSVYEEQEITAPGLLTLFTSTNFVDLTDKRNFMYVYIDGTLQQLDTDYDITNLNPIQITFKTAPDPGAALVIRLYENPASAHIPATPTKLGLYPATRPRVEVDNTYLTPAEVIVGHDGSRTPVYGNEIDELLLELETRIYNGIIDKFRLGVESGDNGTYNIPLKVDTYKPGKFRDTRWSLAEWNDLIKQSFFKWSASNRTDYITNSYYDNANEWTYNYKTVADVDGEILPSGFWRGIFDYYYDTQTPESTPWEMLGFTEKPIWWESCTPRPGDFLSDGTTQFTGYGAGPWPSTDEMWIDIEAGRIRREYDPINGEEDLFDSTFDYWITGSVDERYARPGLVVNYLPVDGAGALKTSPLEAIDTSSSLTLPNSVDASDDYTWADWSPIEYAWRTSESYPFAAVEAMFLARPGEFGEKFWDPEHIYEVPVDREQIVNNENDLRKRIGNDSLYVHGETLGGELQVNTGYQVWISGRLRTLKKDPAADFGDLLRTLNVKLGHKMAGFTDKDTLRVFVEGISVSSAATNLLVPSENIDVALYTGAPAEDYFYGGVLIKALSDNTYQIFGYDILKGQFEYYERDNIIGVSAVNVGGNPASFSAYETGSTYQSGDIIKLNGIFYKAKEAHVSDSFDPELWTKLQSLPVSGGISVTHKPNSTDNLLTIKYGEKLVGPQAVFDFLVGWGDYLERQGWTFEDPGANGEINDWFKVAKDFLLWAGTSWEEGSLIMLSPGGEKAVLNAQEGYPGNVERVSNGVYSILNKEGVAIDPVNTVINREDRLLEVEPSIEQTGIYGLRVSTFETENIVTFDNVTVFNDILYDPVLGTRLARLDFRGRRTLDWTGKLEAAGFIITADGLLPNYENLVDSIRNYHNTEVQLDRPEVENVARHLIGFDDRDYFTDLGVLDDAQFQFYQGLVRQKGTRQAIEKLERNELVTSIEDELNVVEEWALKLGEFGGVCKNQFTEFLIAASEVKDDPQLVQLSYPASSSITRTRAFASADVDTTSNTIVINNHGWRTGDGKTYSSGVGTAVAPLVNGSVYYVIVIDENTVQLATTWDNATATTPTVISLSSAGTGTSHTFTHYPSGRVTGIDVVSSNNTFTLPPTVFINNHPDDTTGSGATATSVLDTDGTLLRIDVLNPGSGYSHPPIVAIGNPAIIAGSDRALARIEYDISTDIASDDVILIDIDDETRWITKPAGTACDVAAELWPEAPEGTYRTTNAGYVHGNDITFTSFDVASLDNIINNTTTPFEHGQRIWMARDPSEEFGVYFMDNYRASTIDAQDQTNFDNVGDNGTWFGGTDYVSPERIILSDGTEIVVGAVDGNGAVTEFSIDVRSSTPFPARGSHVLTSVSSNLNGNNDFTLTVGTANEQTTLTDITALLTGVQYKIKYVGTSDFTAVGASSNTVGTTFIATGVGTGTGTADLVGDAATITMTGDGTATLTSLPREDVINATFEIEVGGLPNSGEVTGVTVLDGGLGYKTGGTFTISRDTYGDERSTNDTDAIITYTVSNGIVDGASVTIPGTGYGRNVSAATVNASGFGYAIDDVLTVVGGTLVYGSATFKVTELTTVAGQLHTNFNSSPANEGTFDSGTGHAVGDVITLVDGSTITVDAATISTIQYQDDTDFDGIGSNGTIVNNGSGYLVGENVTMSDGTVIQVTSGTIGTATPINNFKIVSTTTATNIGTGETITAVNSSSGGGGFALTLGTANEQTTADVGLVTEFTVTTGSTTGIIENNTQLTQSSTTGLGTGFALNMGQANQGVFDFDITFKGSYSVDPSTTNAATSVSPTGGTNCTVDLTIIGDNIPVLDDDVISPVGWSRYLGNTVPNSGSIFAGGVLYDYEITSGLNIDITKDGEAVEENTIADNTPFFTLMNVRFEDSTERALFDPTMALAGVTQTWVDDNGSGLWATESFSSTTIPGALQGGPVIALASFGSEGNAYGVQYTSDDDISTWTGINTPDSGISFPNIGGIAWSTGLNIWVAVMQRGSGAATNVQYSNDDGASWTSVTRPAFTPSTAGRNRVVGASDTMFIVGGNSSTAIKSTDGITFTASSPGPAAVLGAFDQIVSVHWSEANSLWFIGTNNGQVATSSDGDNWTLRTNPSTANDVNGIDTIGSRVFVGHVSGRILYSDDLGDTWTESTESGPVAINSSTEVSRFYEAPDGSIIAGAPGVNQGEYVWRSVDDGVSFSSIDVATQLGVANLYALDMIYDPDYGFILGGRNQTADEQIIATSPDGQTWTTRLQETFFHFEPSNNPVVSITRAGSTATVTTTGSHSLTTGNVIRISGANEPEYNGDFTLLSGSGTTMTYTVSGTPTTPATGTIEYRYEDRNDILAIGTKLAVGPATVSYTNSALRTQDNLIETYKFENAYVYEELSKDTLAQIPVYDPYKGILPGNAAQNLKYVRQRDPAKYTFAVAQGDTDAEAATNASRLVNADLQFDADQIGQLWWDTSTASYILYEQGTNSYRRDNWGRLFPGSSVDIYEWTRSTDVPANWDADGTARNTTDYVQKEEWDPINEEVRTFYYFWVKNRTEIPSGVNRTVAAFEVANIIANPVANLYQWFSPISQDAFMFAGVDNVFTDSNNVFQINYRRADDERPLHVEWELGRDSDPSYEINAIHWNKMVDSLCGFTDEIDIAANAYTDSIGSFNTDATGVDIPTANAITTLEAHGFSDGAGVVYSKNGGVENIGLTEGTMYYVEVISDTELALYPTSQQADPVPPAVVNPGNRVSISPSGTEVHTLTEATVALNNFANAIPTAADSSRGYLVVPDPTLSTTQQLGILSRPMQSMFSDIQAARRVWRDKVNELTNDMILRDIAPTWNSSLSTNNLWEWVDWYADGYDATNTIPVRQVDDTSDLAFLSDPLNGDLVKVRGTRYSIYEYDADSGTYVLVAREASRLNILEDVYTSDQSLEIAIELREIIEALRTNVFIGDTFVYNNSVFFTMLNYVFSEQEDLDWAFKSTYIFLDQTGRTLEQDRVFQEDPFDAALAYITEAKPYHSKVRDFRITRETAIDNAPGTADETFRSITPFLVYDQIRGGDLSVTEMRIAKYEMSLDTSWKGYTTLFDVDGSTVNVRLGAAGRAVNNYRDLLVDVQAPAGGTKAEFEVEIAGGQVLTVNVTNIGSGYTDGTFTFNLIQTSGGGDGLAVIEYVVSNGQVISAAIDATGSGYADGSPVVVDASDVPTPNVGTTLAEFNPVLTGVATTDEELTAVSAINAAITTEFFFDYQGVFLRNTSFGGYPTLDSFALELNTEGSTASGTGYVVGEILPLDAGSGVPISNALFRVATVTGSGGITSLELINGGSYVQTPTVDPVDLLGGSGSGAQVTTLIFENGSAVPWDSIPYDQVGFESSANDENVLALTGSPDGLATTIPGHQASDYDGIGENGSFVPGSGYSAGSANGGVVYPSGLTFTDNSPLADTITRTDGNSFLADGIEPGMQIIVTGCTTDASNNGTYRIESDPSSVTATTITLDAGGVLAPTNGTDLEANATFTFHDIIDMTDGTAVRVDSVGVGDAVSSFTIIEGSSTYLPPASTITQLAVSNGTGSGFSLTLGEANGTSGTFADIPAEESFSGTGNLKEFVITTDTPTFFMFATVIDPVSLTEVEQVLNVDYFYIGSTLTFVSWLRPHPTPSFVGELERVPGAPPAGTDNINLYTYIEAGDLINPQVTAGITEEMVPLDPRENLVLLSDTTSVAINAGGTGYNINDEMEVVGGTRLQSTIAAQTQANFDGAGSNGTFNGGDLYEVGDVIRLVDGTVVAVDAVDAVETGVVTEFTVSTASGRGFLTTTVLNQLSVTSAGTVDGFGTGFQLLPDTNNEADFGNPMTIRADTVSTGAIATFTVLDQGDYYTYPSNPVAVTDTVGGGNNDATFDINSYSFKMHNDTLSNVTFTRNANSASTTLTANVGLTDNNIQVVSTATFEIATRDAPQVVWIGTERIVYHGQTATSLTGLIRGSSGTHPQRHSIGDKVFDGSSNQDIPVDPYVYWVDSNNTNYANDINGQWRYTGDNVHFSDAGDLTFVTTGSISAEDTLRATSGTYIQNSYFISEIIAQGEVCIIDVTTPGTGYSVGDAISLTGLGGAVGATAEVGGVDVNGGITYVRITNRGTAGVQNADTINVSATGNGDAVIDVFYDREGLVLAQGGPIISPAGIVVSRNTVSWQVDEKLAGGLISATTPAAVFLNSEVGNVLPVPAS